MLAPHHVNNLCGFECCSSIICSPHSAWVLRVVELNLNASRIITYIAMSRYCNISNQISQPVCVCQFRVMVVREKLV